MDKKEILKWIFITAAVFLFMILTLPVASLRCDKAQDVCTVISKSIISGEQVAAKFYISQIDKAAAYKNGKFYYPVLMDKHSEMYRLEVFSTKTKEHSEEIIQHILNDDKYEIKGSFSKLINKDY